MDDDAHIHIDFVPFIRKAWTYTRVSLKAHCRTGLQSGTRGMTEWNEWIEAEKQELSSHGAACVQWKKLGTHNNICPVLDFEKQERKEEVAGT